MAILVGYGLIAVLLVALILRDANGTARRFERARIERADIEARGLKVLADAIEREREQLRQTSDESGRGDGGPPGKDPAPDFVLMGGLASIEAGITRLAAEARYATFAATRRRHIDVSVSIARRLQILTLDSLRQLDALERQVEDPEILSELFRIDHLATRLRRHVETLALLGGAVPRRSTRSVPLYTVLRQALSEIEDFTRVKVLPPVEGIVHGYAATEIIHLLAELMENATRFSRPDTLVQVQAQQVAVGLAIDIDDRGLGMPREQYEGLSRLLTDPDCEEVFGELGDRGIGLYVVARIAQRYGITVRLQANVYGGTNALTLLPFAVLDRKPVAQPTTAKDEADARLPVPAGTVLRGETQPARPLPPEADTARSPAPDSRALPDDPVSAAEPSADEPTIPAPPSQRPTLPRREGGLLPSELAANNTAADTTFVAPSSDLMARFSRGFHEDGGDDRP